MPFKLAKNMSKNATTIKDIRAGKFDGFLPGQFITIPAGEDYTKMDQLLYGEKYTTSSLNVELIGMVMSRVINDKDGQMKIRPAYIIFMGEEDFERTVIYSDNITLVEDDDEDDESN